MAIDENSPRDWDADLAKLLHAQQGTESAAGPSAGSAAVPVNGSVNGSHFDVALDEAAAAGGMPVEGPETVTPQQHAVIPPVLRSWKIFKAEAHQAIGRWAHIGAFHVVRLPWY